MREQYPALLIIVPLLTALVIPIIAYLVKRLVRWIAMGALIIANISAIGALMHVLNQGVWHYRFGNWMPPWGIEYVIDPLSAGMALLISFISLVVLIYSDVFLKEEGWLKIGMYHTLYLLLTVGLLGMVVTGDVFNFYVFLEISSLSAYGLIASGGSKAVVAAFRYLLIGTIGGSCYLLGVGYLYAITGTLNMGDLAVRVQPLMDSPAVIVAVSMILVGMGIKMALFPMHGWLPDSYTYAPPHAISFISGVMTKVAAYAMFRYFYFIFGAANETIAIVLQVIGAFAAIGIIVGSIMAIAQSDFRRMLAYSSIAQVSYIALGLAIGNMYGLIGAMFHILNHATMKCCLFLIAGGVKWKTGEYKIAKFIEMSRKMPKTMGAFIIAALSMVGIPPTAGFFSKWYLVLGAIEKNMWIYVAAIVLSSLLNAIYFFRIIENAYLKKGQEDIVSASPKKPELPFSMLVPIIVLGIGILIIGIFNEPIVCQVMQYGLPGGGMR